MLRFLNQIKYLNLFYENTCHSNTIFIDFFSSGLLSTKDIKIIIKNLYLDC